MIKKIQIDLILFSLLLMSIFFTQKIDAYLYNYFLKLNYGPQASYLKKFFIGVTELGDSLWYFLILFIIFIVSFLIKKINLLRPKTYSYLKNFSIFGFFYLFLVGFVTQILKHIIGRPRPNHTNVDGFFNFFSTDAAFHSFPSGHSSTIIAVTILFCLVFPKMKIFFYICGILIAISRVVVGAHFVTDVVAGALLAIIIYKFIILYFNKRFKLKHLKDFEIQNLSILIKILVFFIVFAVFITFGFEFDIFLSGLFYYGDNQFFLQSQDFLSIITRKIILPLLLIYIFVMPVLSVYFPIKNIFFNHKFSIKEIFFVWTSGIITLLFVVNFLLKGMWGRSRPNDILQFGGKETFTPWYKFGESCVSNCSFVSGDASVGFMLVAFYFIMQKNIYCYLAIFFGIMFGFIRIIAGGHFFSDVVFSLIIVTTCLSVSFFFYKLLNDK